ncbi:MAG: DUF1616 domain-containing protein [Candidatus Nezhaarchaeota archaeon]|nr:DUF1616 domain-containing protein [Candidatus Nezhaarchaeota archaeon]
MSWVLDEEVLAVLAAIVVVSCVFAAVQAFSAGRVVEPFSELGLLGPEGRIGGYPRAVVAGQPFTLNVYVGNHEGKTMYYRVLVKLGDSASTVNETVFLLAEPIAEVRAVLTHNSSRVIPLNITLREPAVRARLIFELWAFNEAAGDFAYHGRWNQLWINVTGEPVGGEGPRGIALSREMEGRLVEGYLAVRRAEGAGGEVAGMVGLLSDAVNLALKGCGGEAEALVARVLAVEPEVSRLGLEAGRMKLYAGVGISIGVCAAGAGIYMLLRRRVWGWWAKLYRGWSATWRGGASKLNGLEEALRGYLASAGGVPVGDVVFGWGAGRGPCEVARALRRLVRRGLVELVDPNPPGSFQRFFFSRYNLGFALTALVVALLILSVFLSDLSPFVAGLRVVLGSAFTLFIPGCALVEALYPGEGELTPLERLALSVGLSLALVPLVGLALNYTPWGIRLSPVLAALSVLSLGLMFASAYRKFRLLTLKALALRASARGL